MRLLLPFLFLLIGCLPPATADKDSAGPPVDDREDLDGDTVSEEEGDCDDMNSQISPKLDETWYDGINQNCDEESDYDADGDSYDSADYGGEDCDDTDDEVRPSAEDIWYDGVDQDCDGESDYDADGDGYDSTEGGGEDCDDEDSTVNPDAIEDCNDIDDNCDGEVDNDADDADTWYADNDGDTWGDEDDVIMSCDPVDGYVNRDSDCDDSDSRTYSGAEEYCDGIDNNCDGTIATKEQDVDADGVMECEGDCDDSDPLFHPGATEEDCSGTVDYNCDGSVGMTDDDGDGYAACEECNDSNASVNPAATETCDDVDNNCDGEVDESGATSETIWYADADGDGYGSADSTTTACDAPSGYVDDSDDCDDTDEDVNPDATEVCDGADNDCDGDTDPDDSIDAGIWYADSDGDGYGDEDSTTVACDQPSGFVDNDTDCDDTDEAFNPGAVESDCTDATDYNCDGSVGYIDTDGDGYAACEECDDTNADVNPDATEVCDSADNDCDGDTDEDDATDASTWYADADGDEYGDPSTSLGACGEPSGYVDNDDDCDDTDSSVSPDAGERCSTSYDDDCDGDVNEDDATGTLTWYLDDDSDGFGDEDSSVEACTDPSGYVTDNTDCDDTDSSVNPEASETCDGIDNDCDGGTDPDDSVDAATWYADTDSDGYGDEDMTAKACGEPSGYVDNDEDCDDTDASVKPGATEVCDSVDNDCNGDIDDGASSSSSSKYWEDADGDGFGDPDSSVDACGAPSGYVENDEDCDDTDASVNPDATEECNEVDDNCDGDVDEGVEETFYADADGDGYGDSTVTEDACEASSGYVDNDDDCDDTDSSVSLRGIEFDYVLDPTSSYYLTEVDNCGDGVDNNCDGDSDSSDWDCSDADADGIKNGADPYIGGYNIDADSTQEVCALAENLFSPEWTMDDTYVQVRGTWTTLATELTLTSITVSGDSVSAWCYEPTSSGTGYAGFVSTIGVDGSSAVDTTDCSDWVRPVEDVCDSYGDHYCEPYWTSSDGCTTIDNRGFDWSLSSSGKISPG